MTGTNGGNQRKVYLYLGNSYGSGSTFVVYPLHGSKPLRQITRSWGVYAMADDLWGDVYTTDGNPDSGTITAYTPGGKNVLLRIYVDAAQALAFDGSGNLFAALPAGIAEFAARRTKRLRTLAERTQPTARRWPSIDREISILPASRATDRSPYMHPDGTTRSAG